MELAVERRTLRFRAPLTTAHGELRERELLAVRLRAADGVEGVGEAAPLEPYDGVSLAAAREALEACRPVLADAGDAPAADLLRACRETARLPQALAAIDLALWDLVGRRAGQPVARLLADAPRDTVPVNALVADAEEAAAAARAGFRCVKVKVGLGDDAERVAAVRAAVGPGVAIRVDANGAWELDEARAVLAALAPLGIELAEEPVRGAEAQRALRADSPIPVAMDETGAPASGAADLVCLKLARSGGIEALLKDAAAARAAGSEVYIASSYDGPSGIAGALHAAAALGIERPCGLATLALFADLDDPFPPRAGAIAIPAGPGLGVG
jgi:L-Ala-D/L-Glu epimerase